MEPIEFLHKYATTASHDTDYDGAAYSEPWVALTTETDKVTFNKRRYKFDKILFDLTKYDQSQLIVIDARNVVDDITFYERTIILTNEEQTVSDMVNTGIASNAIISWGREYETDVPADNMESFDISQDSEFMLFTNFNYFDSDFDNTFTNGGSYTLHGYDSADTWYIYDMANKVKYTVNKVGDGGPMYEGTYVAFPNPFYRHATVTQSESVPKKVLKIDLDAVQHASQHTDKTWSYDEGTPIMIPNKHGIRCISEETDTRGYPYGQDVLIEATNVSDYFTMSSPVTDTVNKVETITISTEPLLTDKVSFYISEPYTIMSGETYTYKLIVDEEEVVSTSWRPGARAETNITYSHGQWSAEFFSMEV